VARPEVNLALPALPARNAAPGDACSVLVIGAGWAGLSAAVRLVQAGRRVSLIDSAPQAGGRARTQTLHLDGENLALDNGQHLLMGAYHATLDLLHTIGILPEKVLARHPLTLQATDGLMLRAPRWPAPFHLLGALLNAQGLSLRECLALSRAFMRVRFQGVARLAHDLRVSAWLAQSQQPQSVIARIWQPLCLGALNTLVDDACAKTFVRVLRDALLSRADASDFLVPHSTLGTVLPDPAIAWLRQHKANVMLRTTCRQLQQTPEGSWQALTDRGSINAHQIVLALPPHHVARLIGQKWLPPSLCDALGGYEYEPIATVWLTWRQTLHLPHTLMLTETPPHAPGQWLFRRPHPENSSTVKTMASVIISGCARYPYAPEALAKAVSQQLITQCRLPPPDAARTVIDRHATIRCTPDRPKLDTRSLTHHAPGLYLAGDWVWHDYPATLESAVRSGSAAAATLCADTTRCTNQQKPSHPGV
jgi:squalene-associated FAD-dependent desaturase